jgi:hypothetical protein
LCAWARNLARRSVHLRVTPRPPPAHHAGTHGLGRRCGARGGLRSLCAAVFGSRCERAERERKQSQRKEAGSDHFGESNHFDFSRYRDTLPATTLVYRF